ncbi:hypothetical protein Tco_0417402 [Tanacetum coccineum]
MNLKRRSKNRQERWSGNRKFLQQSSIPRSLAIWGKADGITTLVKSILDGFGSVSFGQGGGGSWRREQSATPTYNSVFASHPRPCPSKTFSEPPVVAEIDTVFGCIKSFHKVGTIWRRLVSKVAMKGVSKEMSKYLGDIQFGVGVSGGAEAVLHSINTLLSKYHNDESLAMLTVDFSNEFHLVDR